MTLAVGQAAKERLQLNFELSMRTDIFMEWEEVPDPRAPGRLPRQRLVSWIIENLQERTRRQALSTLENFERSHGFPLEKLVAAVKRARHQKAKDGSAPLPWLIDERTTRALKNAGRKMTLGTVKRFRELVERYRPDLLSPARGPKILHFRPSPAGLRSKK